MKKILSIALIAASGATALGSFAAVGNQLRGSDTLEIMTQAIIAGGSVTKNGVTFTAPACAGVAPLVYIGGGSSNGEQAMLDAATGAPNTTLAPEQVVSPMSRFLDPSRTCRAQDPSKAEGYLVALDGLAVVSKESNTQCSGGVAYTGCIDVADLNGTPGVSNDECPGCESGNAQYCFSNEFDVLRVLFAGMHKTGGSAIANQRCNSDVRHSLAASWDKLHEGSCATGECSRLEHAWRRDDLSGTTDTFLGLLGLPAIGTKPFCNGTSTEDLDPVRRPCQANDITCNANGQAGLVLPIFVPDLAPAFEGNAYATVACQNGKFGLAPSKNTDLGQGQVKRDCPERENFSIAGFCLAPQSSSGSFRCNSAKNNPNVFFASLTDDARLFNKWVRTDAGDLATDKAGRPETFGWHKIRQACQQESSTLNIGCLTGEYACTWGFAGREADDAFTTSKSLSVKNILPTDENVRKLLQTPVPADKYPLARGLYFNTLVGFEAVGDGVGDLAGEANEKALTACFANQASADFGAVTSGFITLGIAPRCEDFDETKCNTVEYTCDTNPDCGGVGTCVGGDTTTPSVKEGTCKQTCTTSAECTQGRTCNSSGRCVFASNTNACATL